MKSKKKYSIILADLAGLSFLVFALCALWAAKSNRAAATHRFNLNAANTTPACVRLDSSWATPSVDDMVITGTVTNYCPDTSGPVRVRFKLLRGSREVAEVRASATQIKAGESWHFRAVGPPADSYGFAELY